MRINYYTFPADTPPQTIFKYGGDNLEGYCPEKSHSCRWTDENKQIHYCEHGHWTNCEHFVCTSVASETISGISVSKCKQLLKQFGGSACTYHIDRDGGVFEVTEIKLKGNNSRFKYNRHL